MLELVSPDVARREAWLASHREWGPGFHEDGFGLGPEDDVETADGFAAWVSRLRSLPAARMWWIVDSEAVLGGIALRTVTDDRVLRLGHVGFGIRPSARGRGIAGWAVAEVLPHARAEGLGGVLLVCLDDNAGSIKTIERHGGVLEKISNNGRAVVRHYWIDL
jgi:predicted acetyltransferase